jgi:hypothetical protein
MDYVLTDHARKRCIRRKIQAEWIAEALAHPTRTENDMDDPELAHALLVIPEKGFRVLRVIYKETVDPAAVITAYFDDEVVDL